MEHTPYEAPREKAASGERQPIFATLFLVVFALVVVSVVVGGMLLSLLIDQINHTGP